jgi:hypothetical protein
MAGKGTRQSVAVPRSVEPLAAHVDTVDQTLTTLKLFVLRCVLAVTGPLHLASYVGNGTPSPPTNFLQPPSSILEIKA